ncbi:hypothetical protein Vadar_013080 [Vaccinium darrowii]|uniref:Uncharacterized protein n=1 Tax=Vaccinium darrowii TaxID=229202 RepID=A0ACB7XH36_9ERIC|nr:hypothetical protein Vadar_013080 [Vaccinium darrowii]
MENRQGTVAAVESLEPEKVEEVEIMIVEEDTVDVIDVVEENVVEEDGDEDEWHTKSWDDADLKLPGKSAFADEKDDSELEQVVKKEASTSKVPVVAPKVMQPYQLNLWMVKSEANLRSPICCIMGHVNIGKTKLLDCIRGTNVHEDEAGGITQQIGEKHFPAEKIRERTKELKAEAVLKVPGLLVIDTPGHEELANLRSRGSGLCDIAILVIDIMNDLKSKTIESLNLLKMRNTEFIVALNKVEITLHYLLGVHNALDIINHYVYLVPRFANLWVDLLNGWIACRNAPIFKRMKQQSKDVQLGRIASFENNHKPVEYAKKGQKMTIKIVGSNSEEQQKMFGRHFGIEDKLVSNISRMSIDVLRDNYRDDRPVFGGVEAC